MPSGVNRSDSGAAGTRGLLSSPRPDGGTHGALPGVDGLALVEADWLAEGFQRPGPLWSRHDRSRQGRAWTVIHEVFSPALERWPGPATRVES
jgi:hypothetical protein